MMVPVTLIVPAALLRQVREEAALYCEHGGDSFAWAVRTAAAEFMLAHTELRPLDKPRIRGPVLSVVCTVHVSFAHFVAHLAGRSGLTQAEAWHVVIEEFVARELAPVLNQEAA
jgi:hypothetical protein